MAKRKTSATEQIQRLGERIARQLAIPATQLRYAQYIVHNGQQWTLEYRWERLSAGRWIEIEDRDWNQIHTTPNGS